MKLLLFLIAGLHSLKAEPPKNPPEKISWASITICELSGNGKDDKVIVDYRPDGDYGIARQHFDSNIPQQGIYILARSGASSVCSIVSRSRDEIRDMSGIYGVEYSAPIKELVEHILTLKSAQMRQEAEQAGAGQPATRPELKSEGSQKLQPESKGRSR